MYASKNINILLEKLTNKNVSSINTSSLQCKGHRDVLLHGVFEEVDYRLIVVAPSDVVGRSKSTQSQLVREVDDDLHTLQVTVVTCVVDGEPGSCVRNGWVGSSTGGGGGGGSTLYYYINIFKIV